MTEEIHTTAAQLINKSTTLTTDSRDTLLPHPLGERSAGLPVAVLVCVVPHNKSSSMDPGGLKGCREIKLVLLVREEVGVVRGGGCGHV